MDELERMLNPKAAVVADEFDRRAREIVALRERVAEAEAEADRLREDARDAGEASMQAAFWRARAIELGASEDEYRRHVDELQGDWDAMVDDEE